MNEGIKEKIDYCKNLYPNFKQTFDRLKLDADDLWSGYIHDGRTRKVTSYSCDSN